MSDSEEMAAETKEPPAPDAAEGKTKSQRHTTKAPHPTLKWADAERLLNEWHLRITTAQFGHQLQAERTRNWNLVLGIPVVIATTIVGTAAFAAINNNTTSNGWKIAAGVVSIFAAVLAALQTFFSFGDRSERHRIAATRYASTRRSIELALARHETQAVDRIRIDMDRIGGPSPQIGHTRWDEASGVAKEQIARWRSDETTDLEGLPGKHAAKASIDVTP